MGQQPQNPQDGTTGDQGAEIVAYTPGPWMVRRPANRIHVYAEHEKGEKWLVAETTSCGEIDAANARLIAAAPKLLLALRRLVYRDAAAAKRHGLEESAECQHARHVIAEATGQGSPVVSISA